MLSTNSRIESTSNAEKALDFEKAAVAGRDKEVYIARDYEGGSFYKAQDIFDALRRAGHTDKPRTAADAIEELEPGQRFRLKNNDCVFVRVARGYLSEGCVWSLDANGVDVSAASQYPYELEVLPPLPKGDVIVEALTPGVKFTVDGGAFIRTTNGQAVDLADGSLYSYRHFADRNVEVSK